MLINTFCSVFKCLSLTVFLVLADVGVFIAELVLGLNKSGQLLEVNSDTLLLMGGNYAPEVKNGAVWRLISAIFLHVTFMHILGNIFTTFILVSRIQYTYGLLKTFIFYLVCGVGGNILSLAVKGHNSSVISAGASTALFGMVGIVIGYIIINWSGLIIIGDALRCQIVCTAMLFLIFALIFTPSGSNIDYFGHLGGFGTGIWISFTHETIAHSTYEKVVRIIFAIFLLLQLGIPAIVFFVSN